nr:hypothetical protein [Tanacetum cinerariifolium]
MFSVWGAKNRKDHDTRRVLHFTSSSTFDQPSSSHLNDDDDDDDENDEGNSRASQIRRIRHEEETDFHEYQILTREILSTLKPLEEIIRENVFCLGGACVFSGRWSLDELTYGVPSDGPYQTNLPSPDDIILTIQIDQE